MAARQGDKLPATGVAGITLKEFAHRRRQLMRMAGTDGALLLAAAPQRMRNGDAPWPYRQDSDFHYLTGFPEPQAVLALLPDRAQGEVILFCRERDATAERLHGPRIGTEAAVGDYGVDDAFPIDDVDDILPGMLEGRARVYCHFGRDIEFDGHLTGWMRRLRALRGGGVVPKEFLDLGHLLHDLRLYKSRAELKCLREAAAIGVAAHARAQAVVRPGVAEYVIEAELRHALRVRGAVASFPPTVAGGANACIGHYLVNRATLNDGDLLLVDAGAEVNGYASDIARTVPVNGRFSRAQRALYELVWDAQQAAIAAVRPGQPFDAAHRAAVDVLAAGLCDLKLIEGDAAAAVETGAYRRFFPYKTGHWLGLDVHDVGDYRVDGQSRLLEPGMVVTVEPGLYIPPDATDVAPEWRGIGIRIEDDVVVTRDGHDVLSAELPSAADAVEAALAQRQLW
ncbi:MAG TPA: aminopeptidase P N-terminal domain-containing protein [Rhodanobacteraceae bacterium]